MRHHERPAEPGWRFRLHEIVFEADTPAGKLFDSRRGVLQVLWGESGPRQRSADCGWDPRLIRRGRLSVAFGAEATTSLAVR